MQTMSTVTRTHPELAASRHGFPLPLTGVAHADVDTLLRHAPIRDARFHVTYEGEIFAVQRHIEGVAEALLDRRHHWAAVHVERYVPPSLDDLIGAPMGAPRNGHGLTGQQQQNTGQMLVFPAPEGAASNPIIITDTYERIAGGI